MFTSSSITNRTSIQTFNKSALVTLNHFLERKKKTKTTTIDVTLLIQSNRNTSRGNEIMASIENHIKLLQIRSSIHAQTYDDNHISAYCRPLIYTHFFFIVFNSSHINVIHVSVTSGLYMLLPASVKVLTLHTCYEFPCSKALPDIEGGLVEAPEPKCPNWPIYGPCSPIPKHWATLGWHDSCGPGPLIST